MKAGSLGIARRLYGGSIHLSAHLRKRCLLPQFDSFWKTMSVENNSFILLFANPLRMYNGVQCESLDLLICCEPINFER